uniref:Ig-like domain-containing protein n=1 Tax=Astatotilapia calliptera TaxID=8154 RepID=A0A3P8NDV4_ASTCA
MEAVVLLLLLRSVCECDSSRVKGQPGQDVTLPCKYDRKYHRSMNVCWQRGEIPARGCSNPLISTDGLRVLTRASSRYELLGRLEDGDVSLTIKSLTEGDAGRYGCRVRIPGWFNDDKHHFDLSVATAEDLPHILTTITTMAEQTGSDVTDLMTTHTQTEVRITAVQQADHLEIFIRNSARLTFIIFIPALLTAAHRVWRCGQRLKTNSRLSQSEEEESPV